ncbi:MAG: KTSC domain-containing protein [Ignavibacteria bacterium]
MSVPEMIQLVHPILKVLVMTNKTISVYIRFLNGSLYVYKGVPKHEHRNLMNAPSHGTYLSRSKNVSSL